MGRELVREREKGGSEEGVGGERVVGERERER